MRYSTCAQQNHEESARQDHNQKEMAKEQDKGAVAFEFLPACRPSDKGSSPHFSYYSERPPEVGLGDGVDGRREPLGRIARNAEWQHARRARQLQPEEGEAANMNASTPSSTLLMRPPPLRPGLFGQPIAPCARHAAHGDEAQVYKLAGYDVCASDALLDAGGNVRCPRRSLLTKIV